MSKSYEKVNYLLRLKKQIERKLIIETLQHLDANIDIRNYHYFGFGSVYFADFIMFHKYLNISKMTSIDDEQDDEKRFIFNKPFGFITFKISKSNLFLTKELNWNNKLLIWLDYDSCIDFSMIEDAEFIASKAKPFDIIFFTIEATSPPQPDDFLETFRSYIPPHKLKPKSITEENFPEILNSIILTSIQKGLNNQMKQIKFLQLFNLIYKDTTKMFTFGGIFCNDDNIVELKNKLSGLHYISHDDRITVIDCPILTLREKLYVDNLIYTDGRDDKCIDTGLNEDDVSKYIKYYKYYPQFFESIY